MPSDAPISFSAVATDDCSAPSAAVTAYGCVVGYAGGTLTIGDSGGVGDHIAWRIAGSDATGNSSSAGCEVPIVKKR